MDIIIILYLISSVIVLLNLTFAAYLDIKYRRVPFQAWYPMLIFCTPLSGLFYAQSILTNSYFVVYIGLVIMFCAAFYIISRYMKTLGGADAWALIFITIFVPILPTATLVPVATSSTITMFFPIAVIVCFVIAVCAVPAGLLILNLIKGEKAPLLYLLTCQHISAEDIPNKIGFIMENITVSDAEERERGCESANKGEGERGGYTHTYLKTADFIKRILKKDLKYHTKYLINHIEVYEEKMTDYSKAGEIWITYTVPLILPMTAGYVMAYIAGYILLFN